MSQPNDRIWILLVQKSPKGPFTLAEVNALLDKGIIRRNDLALKMEAKEAGADGKKVGGSWRILWQYAEFDRRKDELSDGTTALAAPVPMPPREGDRRIPVDEEKKAGLLKDLLPEELGEIKAEDLIGKSSREIRREEDTSNGGAELAFNSDSVRPPEDESGAPKWIYALIVLAVGGAVYGWFTAVNPLKKGFSRPSASSDALTNGGAHEEVPSIRRGVSSPLGRTVSPAPAGRHLPLGQQPARRMDSPPPGARREFEPNRNEESRLDRPAEERQIEGERGEIPPDSEDRNVAGDEEEPIPKGDRTRKRLSKESVADEEEGGNPAPQSTPNEAGGDVAPAAEPDAAPPSEVE